MKRVMAVIVAVLLWILSMRFSVAGFGADISKNPDDVWIGWTLAFAVTAFELIWNGMKERTNLTMYTVGVLCYGYGIATNILGIMAWRGMTLDDFMTIPSNPAAIVSLILSVVFVVCLALVIEISPEPAFIWGITGDHTGGDFLGNIFGNYIPVAPKHKEWGVKDNPSYKNSNGHTGNNNSNNGNSNKDRYVPGNTVNKNGNQNNNNQKGKTNSSGYSPNFATHMAIARKERPPEFEDMYKQTFGEEYEREYYGK